MSVTSVEQTTTTSSNWDAFAEQFKLVTSPARPSADDVAIIHRQLLSLKKPLRGILLGVTKELAELASDEISIIAVDNAVGMINHVWVGNNSNRTVKLGNWLDLQPVATNVDFVIGDGMLNVLDRTSQHRLMESIRSVLADDGLFIVRLFSSPETREDPQHVRQTATRNFFAFLWRLAQSIADANREVTWGAVLEKFKELISPSDIAQFGWTKGEVAIFEADEGSPELASFLTEAMFNELCEGHGMKVVARSVGSYELSERCPTFVVRKV